MIAQLPQINKTYNCFDDGKITISRHYLVTIKEIIPFDEIDLATLKIWESAKRDRGVLAKETDHFIKFIGEDNIEGTFVRCNRGSWFGIGTHDCAVINSGRIDFSKTEKEIMDSKDDIIEALLKCYIDCLDITEKDHFIFTNNFRDAVTTSWKYEYAQFELVRIYKTFDWENNKMVYYGY